MCGRFTMTMGTGRLVADFGVTDPPALPPRYNVAPRQVVAVVGLRPNGERRVGMLSWGLVPGWSDDPDSGPRPINARAETLLAKPMFRSLLTAKRCLVPADGFFEWRQEGKRKAAYHIRLKGGGALGFAGLWDVWAGGDGRKLASCCIITTSANELVRPIHDRMPVVIPPERYGEWLDPNVRPEAVLPLLVPFPAERMEAVPVGPAVNRVANDGPECLEAA